MSDGKTNPVLRVEFKDSSGKTLIAPLEMSIPMDLSARIAALHVTEKIGKTVKAGLKDALKALGFK